MHGDYHIALSCLRWNPSSVRAVRNQSGFRAVCFSRHLGRNQTFREREGSGTLLATITTVIVFNNSGPRSSLSAHSGPVINPSRRLHGSRSRNKVPKTKRSSSDEREQRCRSTRRKRSHLDCPYKWWSFWARKTSRSHRTETLR